MIHPSRILQTRELETQYERWKKQRAAVQKSYQNNSSTSPNMRTSQNVKPTLKKQSSFLIEKNKSMLEISDELSDNSANGGRGFITANSRLTK